LSACKRRKDVPLPKHMVERSVCINFKSQLEGASVSAATQAAALVVPEDQHAPWALGPASPALQGYASAAAGHAAGALA
jgi:hypothetical protein